MFVFKKRIVPLHCAVVSYPRHKYLAEDLDGSWNVFSTKPVADEENGIWKLNSTLKRAGTVEEFFIPSLGYPDNTDWMNTLQTITYESMNKHQKIIYNLKPRSLVVLKSSQIGIVTQVSSSSIRIQILSNDHDISIERAVSDVYFPIYNRNYSKEGVHNILNGTYLGSRINKDGVVELTYRYRSIVGVISLDDIYYKGNN